MFQLCVLQPRVQIKHLDDERDYPVGAGYVGGVGYVDGVDGEEYENLTYQNVDSSF